MRDTLFNLRFRGPKDLPPVMFLDFGLDPYPEDHAVKWTDHILEAITYYNGIRMELPILKRTDHYDIDFNEVNTLLGMAMGRKLSRPGLRSLRLPEGCHMFGEYPNMPESYCATELWLYADEAVIYGHTFRGYLEHT